MAALDTRPRIARLLQRTGFGLRAADVDFAMMAGFDGTLDAVLRDGRDPGAAETPAPHLVTLQRPRNIQDSCAVQEYREALQQQRHELTIWWLDRMAAVHRPWQEKRTFLWHDHWATGIDKVASARAMLVQNQTLRRLGDGDFRTLARHMITDPALMVWLDAGFNVADGPNENLARELMELFVLGVNNYKVHDIRQAAAALTGWTIDRQGKGDWRPVFRARLHAQGPQTVLGRTTDFTAGTLVDHLVDQPASPRHVASRFWARLVSAENPPSKQSMNRMVKAYGKKRDVSRMLRAMFTDPAFADPDNVLVKQPVEYVVGALRAFGLRPAKLPQQAQRQLLGILGGLGQVPFSPPNVGGWPHGVMWLTTSAAAVRIQFAQQLVGWADLSAVEQSYATERPAVLARLLGVDTWGKQTTAVLASAAEDPRRVTAIALTAPEYLVQP